MPTVTLGLFNNAILVLPLFQAGQSSFSPFLPLSLSSLIPFNTYPSLLPIYTYFLFALLSSSPYIFLPSLQSTARQTSPQLPPLSCSAPARQTPTPLIFVVCTAFITVRPVCLTLDSGLFIFLSRLYSCHMKHKPRIDRVSQLS